MIFCTKFAPHDHVICASAPLLFHLLFLISDFGQNFAKHLTVPFGRGNFSFQSNCASGRVRAPCAPTTTCNATNFKQTVSHNGDYRENIAFRNFHFREKQLDFNLRFRDNL